MVERLTLAALEKKWPRWSIYTHFEGYRASATTGAYRVAVVDWKGDGTRDRQKALRTLDAMIAAADREGDDG